MRELSSCAQIPPRAKRIGTRPRHTFLSFAALVGAVTLIASPTALLARSDTGPDSLSSYARMTHEIPRSSASVTVDGVLDDPLWRSALAVHLPFETSPGENTPAPVATECYLAYDTSNLYVAFKAVDDDPAQIKARLSDRDNIWHDDRVGIMIDTFNDERRGFEFLVNPLGVQMDATRNEVGGNSDSDTSWDAIWNSAGRISDDGYAVEMAIPFTSLRFPRTDGSQTWGFAAYRYYPRGLHYEMMSVPSDRDEDCFFCQAGKLAGFEGISPGNNIELAPTFTSSRNDRLASNGTGGLESGNIENEIGLSMRWGVTPNVSLNATFNPDFSQVEADVAQLNVNNRFALFFPEKRPFFLEGADFFDTPFNAVYTRTVVMPKWGFKSTGKEGSSAFGAFVAQDETPGLLFPANQGSRLTSHHTGVTTGVARYRRDMGESSTLGLIATGRTDQRAYHNGVFGADGFVRLSATNSVDFQLLGSSTRYANAIAESFGQPLGNFAGYAGSAHFNHTSRSWLAWAWYEDKDPNFRADAGFVTRVDTRAVGSGLQRRIWGGDDTWYTRLGVGVEGSRTQDHSGRMTDQFAAVSLEYRGPMQSFYRIRPTREDSYYDGDTYNLNYLFMTGQFQPLKNLRAWGALTVGDGIDYANSQPAYRIWGGPGIEYTFGQHLKLFLDHTYEQLIVDDQRLFLANLVNMNLAYQFSARTFARAVVQYTDISRNQDQYSFEVDTSQRDLFTQLLFAYKVNPQTLFYLGYTDSRYGEEVKELEQVDRTLFVKVGYAWVK